jgi:hypothetical protein
MPNYKVGLVYCTPTPANFHQSHIPVWGVGPGGVTEILTLPPLPSPEPTPGCGAEAKGYDVWLYYNVRWYKP